MHRPRPRLGNAGPAKEGVITAGESWKWRSGRPVAGTAPRWRLPAAAPG